MRAQARCVRFVLGLLALAVQALAGEQAGEVVRLLPSTPMEREIAPGEAHLYEISAEANRFVRIMVDQPGVDLRVSVREKDGAVVTEVNNPGERQVSEVVSLLAEAATTWLFELRAPPGTAGPGRYRIRVEELREPLPEDRLRIAAERAEAVADRQYLGQTAEGLGQAVEGYRTALERWREVGDPRKAGEIVFRLGLVQRLRGEPREALQQLEQALEAFRELGDRAWQAAVLNQRGLVYWQIGETDKAFAAFDEALALRRALGDADNEAKILNNLGLLHHRAGRLRTAREAYLQALEIFRRTGDRKREGILLGNLGNVHEYLGEPLAAIRLQEEALALARALGDRDLEAQAQNSLGLVYRQLGEPQKALESYHAALPVFRTAGNRGGEATALNNLGSMSIELGLAEEALGPLRQAIEIHREIGARGGQASALNNLGRALSALGRPAEALEAFSRALELHRAAQDRSGEAATLGNLGLHYVSRRRDREALEPLRQALAIRQELGDRYREARVRHILGRALLSLGETGPALEELETALRLHREVGDPAGEAAALQEIGRAELARGNLEQARARLEPALGILESQRLRVSADRLRTSYFASFHEVYELYIDLLMSLHARQPGAGFDTRAFEAAEAARARSLLDLLREARVELRRGADSGLLDEERRLRLELSGKAERQARVLERKHTEEEAAEARRELEEALAAYEIAEARLRAGSPAYAGLLRPEAITLSSVQALLDEDTVLLEYALGERRSFLWAMTPADLRSFELPGRAEIEAAAREAHESLRTLDPGQGARRREVLSRLGRMLLGPVAGSLGEKRLAVVAGAALQLVPFAALPLPSGEPVLAAHEVVSLPSSAVLGELRRKTPSAAPGALAVLA
ncbi:MAG TPA: tetratricopeptide repeat protein, partial [Thermoanaerobaculia bacterium]|nr:tetratricopeptide repeat protein [Thermoanaerobaculia bacterium]